MDPTANLIFGVLGGLIQAAPGALDTIERWVAGEKAKRVEEIRPATSHTDAAIAGLRRARGTAPAASIEEAAKAAAEDPLKHIDADIRRRVFDRIRGTLSAEEIAAFRPVT